MFKVQNSRSYVSTVMADYMERKGTKAISAIMAEVTIGKRNGQRDTHFENKPI